MCVMRNNLVCYAIGVQFSLWSNAGTSMITGSKTRLLFSFLFVCFKFIDFYWMVFMDGRAILTLGWVEKCMKRASINSAAAIRIRIYQAVGPVVGAEVLSAVRLRARILWRGV